jgi:hypothetical protein
VAIVKAIGKFIIKKHGISKRIFTDNGLKFKNEHADEIEDKYVFEWIYNSPGHHKTIGVI